MYCPFAYSTRGTVRVCYDVASARLPTNVGKQWQMSCEDQSMTSQQRDDEC